MNHHTPDALRLLTRDRHDQRLREADAEQLARETRGTRQHHRRPRLILGLALNPSRRASQPRLEA